MATPAWESTVARLVADRGDSLTRYAWLLCGDRDDAADLVQDALVKTFGRLSNDFTVHAAEAYVRRAILTIFLDGARRRTRWRRIAHLTVVPERVEAPSTGSETRLDMWQELSRLAPRERACVVLRYYDDLTVGAIAAELNISSGAVKRYLSDGLAKMSVSLMRDRDRDRSAVVSPRNPISTRPASTAGSTTPTRSTTPARTTITTGGIHAH